MENLIKNRPTFSAGSHLQLFGAAAPLLVGSGLALAFWPAAIYSTPMSDQALSRFRFSLRTLVLGMQAINIPARFWVMDDYWAAIVNFGSGVEL